MSLYRHYLFHLLSLLNIKLFKCTSSKIRRLHKDIGIALTEAPRHHRQQNIKCSLDESCTSLESQAAKAKKMAEGSITGNPTMGQPLRINDNAHVLDCKASGLIAAIVVRSILINRGEKMINGGQLCKWTLLIPLVHSLLWLVS